MRIYVEQWRPRPAWSELDAEQRATFLEAVGPACRRSSTEVPSSSHSARPTRAARSGKPQYFAVWHFPDLDLVRLFERRIEGAGWYEYSDQVDLGGETVDLDVLLQQLAAA